MRHLLLLLCVLLLRSVEVEAQVSIRPQPYIDGAGVARGPIDLGAAGVRLSGDGDGAITFLGLGDGADEDLTLNLDDTANTGVVSSSTGLIRLTFTAIGHTLGADLLFGTDNAFDIGASGATRPRDYYGAGKITSAGPTAGIGYATGAGGTVTQATSKSTAVTLNTVTGQVTMNAAALAADTTVSFTLTNSAIAATDLVVLNHLSGGTAGAYTLNAQAAAGSASVNVRNITAASLSEAIVIAFAVIKAVTS